MTWLNEGRGYVVSVRGPKGYAGPEVQVYVSEAGRVVRAYPIRGAKVNESYCEMASRRLAQQSLLAETP